MRFDPQASIIMPKSGVIMAVANMFQPVRAGSVGASDAGRAGRRAQGAGRRARDELIKSCSISLFPL